MNRKTKQLLISLVLGLELIIGLLGLLGGLPPMAHAQGPDGHDTYYVAPGGNCGGLTPCYDSVQAAVDAVDDPGDVVKIAAGTYTDVQARDAITQVVYISKTVTASGGYTTTNWTTPYPITQPTTLDAQGQGRVLYITGNISPTIEGLRITGGDGGGLGGGRWGDDAGGGVYIITATATISVCQVFSNTVEWGYGSGLYLWSSEATLSGNDIISNTAFGGGGLYLEQSDAMLSANTITSNTAKFGNGGGLCLVHDSDATVISNTISANDANTSGGGLYLLSSNALFIANTFTANDANTGGGLHLEGGDVMLNANTVTSNTAGMGGGLFLEFSDATFSANTVISNTANGTSGWQGRGGGLLLVESDATLTNTVVADNQADSSGSGLYIWGSSPHLLHTTIARNSGGDGSGMYVYGFEEEETYYSTVTLTNTILVSHSVGITVTGGNTVTVNSILWYDTPITVSQATTATVTVQNQYQGDPAFAADGYHLTADSEAIDKGVDAGVTVDIDGQARPHGSAPDLGADEYVSNRVYLPTVLKNYAPPAPPSGPDLVVSSISVSPPTPTSGQLTTIYVTVKNQGNQATASWFFIDLYVDPVSPPDDRADLGTYYEYGPSGLAPGQTHQVSFSHTFGSGGDHTLYAQVDTYDGFSGSPDYGIIQENNEGNNIYGPVSVSVSGANATKEEAPLPGSGPRPTPTVGP